MSKTDFHAIAENLIGLVPEERDEPKVDPAELARRREQFLPRAGVLRRVRKLLGGELVKTQALRRCEEFEGGLLALSGGAGCGKTIAAAWWLGEMFDPEPWTTQSRVRFLSASGLEQLSRYDREEMQDIRRCPALVIDDLGTEYLDRKGQFVSLLDGLLDYRYADERDTIITTNLTAKEFRESYGERIADRIREWGSFVSVNEPSLRRGRSVQAVEESRGRK